ncbi:MAG: hypothetical protein CMN30_09210 [Sandaracinus sp.]|nr:hypothetical protein [Sandaracinus sp.]
MRSSWLPLVLLLVALAAPSAAQEPEVLSPAEVATEAQQVLTGLLRLEARIHHEAQFEHHLAEIESLGRRVARLERDSDLDTLETQPLRELRNLKEHWTELDARLGETGAALEESSRKLEEELESLRAQEQRWEGTRAAATDYPEAARVQVDEVLAGLAEGLAGVDANLERVLGAQTRLAAHAITSGDVLTQLEHALEESQERLVLRTHPVGLGGIAGRPHASLGEQLGAAALHYAHAVDRFATTGGPRFYLHGLFALLVLAWLQWLRRETRGVGQAARGDRHALEHPIALTAMITLLSVRAFYPLAPRAVVELAQVLAIVPLLFVRPAPRIRRITVVVVGLYLVEWLRLLLEEHGAAHRVVLLASCLGGAVGFAVIARRQEGPAKVGWGAASAVAAAGLVAGLGGYVPLSVVLVEGVIASAYVAVVLITLHWALMGLTEAGLTTRAAQNTVLGRHAEITRMAAHRAIRLGLTVGFLWVALDYFRLQDAVVSRGRAMLAESFALGEVDISLGEVLAFGLGIWAAVVLSRVLSAALEEDVAPRMKLGPGVPAAAALIVRYTVLAVGFVLAAAAAGIGLSQLALFAGALGVGVGFGLQNVVSNFVSGLLLVFERPVKVGDTVDIAGFRGTITAIGIRASTVRSWSGADVIIPNSKLIESELVNWTHIDPSMRVDLAVGVAYGSDLQKTHAALTAAAKSVRFTLESPRPLVLMTGFGDSSIDFQVQIWIANPPDMPEARSLLGLAIDDALAAADIEIPFPQRDLHIRSDATKG